MVLEVGETALTVTGLSQILTIYYFVHFLVLFPVLGLVEKPKQLPESISAAVLGSSGKASGA